MVLRRLSIPARTLGILAAALAAVAGCAAVIVISQAHGVAARDHQSTLLELRLEVMQMRDIPWDAAPGSGEPAADVRADLRATETGIRSRLAGLRRAGLPNEAAISRRFDADMSALWALYDGVRRSDDAAAATASDKAARETYAVDVAMKRAADAYRDHAARSLLRAGKGSALIVAVLFLAFAWFYVNAVRGRRRAEELVRALRGSERERERLFEEAVQAAETERSGIAAELHDGPIQQLSALSMRLDLAAYQARRTPPAQLPELLAETRDGIADQVGALRRLMVELRPPALDEVGFVPALRDHVTRFAERTGIAAQFDDALSAPTLPPAAETTLYRVAQEALTNVWKHAGAARVHVAVWSDAQGVHLVVADDGAGFVVGSTDDGLQRGHVGLAVMRERVERAGGTWRLESSPGRGTTMEAVVPVALGAPELALVV